MTSLDESEGARRARHFCALERRLFEVVGGWVPSVPEPEAKILLRVHSFQHAWHAELWAGLLPVRVGEAEGDLPPLRPAVDGVLDEVAGLGSTVERVAGMYCVFLPHLVTTYEDLREEELREASDGPVRRVVSLVLADLTEACPAGKGLIQGLAGAVGAGARPEALEGALAAAGGLDAIELV